ncbi:MAG: GIY-YIG nuclease family protein [Cyanobacteria bacterium J06638_6]
MPPQNPNSIEHQHIPVAHQGLHDFLYSVADEHAADTAEVPALEHRVDAPLAVADWFDLAQDAKVAGVYAVLDSNSQTQFIGFSRNVSLSLRGHLAQKGEAVCALVQVQPFKFPKREVMAALQAEWMAALPSPPPGNVDGTWAKTIGEASSQVMSAAEREAYEAKKLKLRRAMADSSLSKEQPQADRPTDPQADLAAAMTDDNWSGLIREQTQDTQT